LNSVERKTRIPAPRLGEARGSEHALAAIERPHRQRRALAGHEILTVRRRGDFHLGLKADHQTEVTHQ
jgi:hypothetical protein